MFLIYQSIGQQSFSRMCGGPPPYDYVYMEVPKRVGEGKRLKEFGQSASASDMDTLKPRVEVKNNVFKENLLFWKNIIYLTGWNLKSSFPICGSEAIQTPSLGNPGSKSTHIENIDKSLWLCKGGSAENRGAWAKGIPPKPFDQSSFHFIRRFSLSCYIYIKMIPSAFESPKLRFPCKKMHQF